MTRGDVSGAVWGAVDRAVTRMDLEVGKTVRGAVSYPQVGLEVYLPVATTMRVGAWAMADAVYGVLDGR